MHARLVRGCVSLLPHPYMKRPLLPHPTLPQGTQQQPLSCCKGACPCTVRGHPVSHLQACLLIAACSMPTCWAQSKQGAPVPRVRTSTLPHPKHV